MDDLRHLYTPFHRHVGKVLLRWFMTRGAVAYVDCFYTFGMYNH